MRILIFLSHPAQFLFYKNPVIRLREKGHVVFILIKTKDILSDLLDEHGWSYLNILPQERGSQKSQSSGVLFPGISVFINLSERIKSSSWPEAMQALPMLAKCLA